MRVVSILISDNRDNRRSSVIAQSNRAARFYRLPGRETSSPDVMFRPWVSAASNRSDENWMNEHYYGVFDEEKEESRNHSFERISFIR